MINPLHISLWYNFTGENVAISVNTQKHEGDEAAFISLTRGVINELSADILGLIFTFYSDASLFPLQPTNGENTTRVVGSAVIGAIIANETIFFLLFFFPL